MIKLTRGQKVVLISAAAPMAAVGIAGAVATFVNMKGVLVNEATALGMVAAGEGATLICALVCLALTLMGQHTPGVVRAGLWVLPVVASGAGIYLAKDGNHAVAMGITPLAMTAAGEGVALVARRIVAFQTGTDIEQQRRSGLLLWHANRAANGKGLAKKRSELAVWRLTKQFAATDTQMSVQLGEVQRYRIGEGADVNLARVLSGENAQPSVKAPELPAAPSQAATEPLKDEQGDDGYAFIQSVLDSAPVDDSDPTAGLWTADDVARQANVKPGTVRSWVHRQKLAVAYRDTDGRAYFEPKDVKALTT